MKTIVNVPKPNAMMEFDSISCDSLTELVIRSKVKLNLNNILLYSIGIFREYEVLTEVELQSEFDRMEIGQKLPARKYKDIDVIEVVVFPGIKIYLLTSFERFDEIYMDYLQLLNLDL